MATTETFKLILDVREAVSSINTLKNVVKGFVGVLAVDQVAEFGKTIIDSAKKFETYRNQLTLVTKGQADLDRVLNVLTQTAIRNRTSFESTIDLFTKLRISTEALGISEERVIDVTSKLSQALQVAGADTATTNSVVRQFGQAMASGTVRGDEFNSLVEGLGPALAIMARESGITVGQLRQMSQSGELTAEVMFKLLENSRALTAAFNAQNTTTEQLEQQLSDAFDRAALSIAKNLKLLDAYKATIETITRFLDRIAGTEDALVNLPTTTIMDQIVSGTINATEGLKELESRLDDLKSGPLGGRGQLAIGPEANELRLFITLAKEIEELQKRRGELTKKELERQAELQKKINEELSKQKLSTGQLNTIIADMNKVDFATPFERLTRKLKETQDTLSLLKKTQDAFIKANLPTDSYANLTGAIAATEEAVKKLQKEVARQVAEQGTPGFLKFYSELIKNAQQSVEQFNQAKAAADLLIRQMLDGKISTEAFSYAMKELNTILEKTEENTENISEIISNYKDSLKEGTEGLQQELDILNLNELDREISQIKFKLNQDLNSAIKRLRKELQDNPQQADRIQREIEALQDLTNQTIKAQVDLVTESYKQQNSFVQGWKNAMDDYVSEVTNGAKAAQAIFQRTTKGMEDLIVNFAKTGKFEFKSFINSILEDLLRSQVRQLLAQVFSFGGKSGSGFVSDFGKLLGFANGGIIPTNSPVLVGERGPEIISGAAGRSVTPNNQLGGTNITYNINAVDAMSFKQMIARDPQFIYAVTEQGKRSIPQTRR